MKNRIQLIYESLQLIRQALYGDSNECAPIDVVVEDVAGLAANPLRIGYSPVIVFSNESNPEKPTANKLTIETGLVANLDESWTQTELIESGSVWMSFAIFDPYGDIAIDWSNPVNIKGLKGDQGIQGIQGIQGVQGESVKTIVCVSEVNGTTTDVPNTETDGVSYYRIKDSIDEWLDGTIAVKNGSKGDKGDKGDRGEKGEKGESGFTWSRLE